MRRALAVVVVALAAGGAPAAERGGEPLAATGVPAREVRPPAPDPRLFPRPPAIEPRVRFWTRVYSEVESNEGLVHDAENLDVVYDVIRWPRELARGFADNRYERAKAQYRAILLRLAKGPRTNLTAEEQRVLALFPRGVSDGALRAAADRIRFQRGQADRFRDGLIRSGTWEDHIRTVFEERGLPRDLASLPHVESSYNPLAYSHAGAAGLWQFMPSTGRRFLRVDGAVDERFDPFRSSEAAAAFLAENHRITGSWPLALTAYNHGPGGVMKAVRTVGSRDIDVLIDRYESRTFGFASKNFYSEFLAACDVEGDALRHFGPLRRDEAVDQEVIVTDGYYSVRGIAQAFGMDIGLLREHNLALRDPVWSGRRLVPRGYALRVPRLAGRPPAAQVLASIPPADRRTEQVGNRYHVVKRGETLSRIARRYGVSQRVLARANGLHNPSHLPIGRRLRIPGAVEVAVATDSAARKPPPRRAATTYRVRKGDTLSGIARRHGISTARLAAANGLSARSHVRIGQSLDIPGTGKQTAAAKSYRVRKGDTLSAIARRHGVSVAQLTAANGIGSRSIIRAGQVLKIPARGTSAVAASDG